MKKFTLLTPIMLAPLLMAMPNPFPYAIEYSDYEITLVSQEAGTSYTTYEVSLANTGEGYIILEDYDIRNGNEYLRFVTDFHIDTIVAPNQTKTVYMTGAPDLDISKNEYHIHAYTSPKEGVACEVLSTFLEYEMSDTDSRGQSHDYYSYRVNIKTNVTDQYYYRVILSYDDGQHSDSVMVTFYDYYDETYFNFFTTEKLDLDKVSFTNIKFFEGEYDRYAASVESAIQIHTVIIAALFYAFFIYGGIALLVIMVIFTAIDGKKKKEKQKN